MSYTILPRIRIVDEDGTIVLGPGKAALLEAIREGGSIRAAAEQLGMSYMRAWSLVRTMDAAFASPLVETERGGKSRGGARLTPRGETVLRLYRRMERKALRAAESLGAELRDQL